MQVVKVRLSDLVEDPQNARLHDERNLAAIRASLERFGQVEPLVVRTESNVVVGGNGRLSAMRALGWKTAEVTYQELTDAQAAALGIALNRTAELATWDNEQLAQTLEAIALEGEGIAELESLGFDEQALKSIEVSSYTRAPAGVVQQDAVPDPPEEPTTQPGDVWVLGDHRLVCGDSCDPKVYAAAVSGETPALMVTDPPYGVEYDPSWREKYDQFERHSVGKVTNDDKVEWRDALANFQGDVLYTWHAGVFAAETHSVIADLGFEVRAQIIWAKQHFVFGRGAYHWKHEPCWYAVRKGKTANWVGDRAQTTVWDISNSNPMGGSEDDVNTKHGTQKPLECMARPIRNHGGDVYDPFLGSGTTLIAAEQLGRRCFGVEISPAYCDVIVERWETLTGERARRETA